MTFSLFEPIMESREACDRSNPVAGIRYAVVKEHTDEGFILEWLSGDVDSPSAPARMACFMAGKERGAFFLPEVGDEVVVGFEDGDLDTPVILGALWSEDVDRPPGDADNTASNNTRGIVSRLGHKLIFDDTQGSGKITTKSKGELVIELDDASAGGKITIKTKNNLSIVLDDAAGTITAEVNSTNKIEMSSTGVTVKGTSITLEADPSNKITIEAGGITVVGTSINLNP